MKKEFAERDKVRYDFFQQLLEKANKATSIFNAVSPVGYQNWVNAGAGKAGIMWTFVVMKTSSRVELFFCHPDYNVNKSRFDRLLVHKNEIEHSFGEELFWDFKQVRKQQYIRSTSPVGGLDDEEKWPDIQNDMVDRLVRLEKAIGLQIKSLK